ncbi:ATP-binding cassette domain-containing protein [Actinomadura litoris]|uniref:ATP-binding cassette domain-containing protein n=1 Tax=Actinomadura litoris TaxID=2678616 RepID=UPI001FA71666|nr:ATP-binding cassette domain-containing protein [Actinomadura litoris]
MRLESVAFRYHRRGPWVLKDVTLTLPAGTVTEVTGRNGAGKSTLLRLIAGLRRPHKGAVHDRPTRVGYAPERFPVDQPFEVRSYLNHMSAMRGVPPSSVSAWTERLGLEHLLNVRLPELSKGSAQKVGLVQALMDEPGLLILDEPFAGLDAATRDSLPSLIAELAAGGTTVVISDHQRTIEKLPELGRIRVANAEVVHLPSALPTSTPPATPRSPEPTPAVGPPHQAEPTTATRATEHPEHSGRIAAAEGTELREHIRAAEGVRALDDGGSGGAHGREGAAAWTVLTVIVREDEADAVESRLRAEGHDVRRAEK